MPKTPDIATYATASPLGAVCARFRISTGRLAELAGSSRTSVWRLLKNTAAVSQQRKLNAVLAKTLPAFLAAERDISPAELDELMTGLFDGEYEPMINQRIELTAAELKFFGLSADPFTRPPQTRDEVFISPEYREIIDRVTDAVHYQGFVSVIGPIGAGKSTLRALISDHVDSNPNLRLVWPEFFDMQNVSPAQIAEAILIEFNAPVPHSSVRRGNAVKQLLANLYKDGKRVAIAFDEAHRLNDSALSSLKNFLEMNSGGFQRYLGVIMFGQPVFEARLRDARFQELVERIVPLHMPDFGPSAEGYLRHRLALVGADADRLFDREALDLICGKAQTPLQLGNIANEAMRVSKSAFNNKQVVGSAISTRMFFENRVQGFKRRKAA